MARKRGGLAGLYDRNKGLVRTAATIGGSLLGGPAAGAAIGAAFRGLDREGKRGIGFDVGQGLRGAAEGYTTGKLTSAAKSSIGKMLAPKMPAGALNMDVINADIARGLAGSTAPTAAAPSSVGMTNIMLPKATMADRPLTRMIDAERISGAVTPQMAAPDIGALSRGVAGGGGGGGGGGSLMGSIGRRATKAMDFANKYEKPLGAMIRGTGLVPNPEAEAQMAANELAREKMAFEQRQIEEENLRRQNMARMLMPQLDRILGLNNAPGSPATRTASPFISGAGPMSLDDAVMMSGATTPDYMAPATMGSGTAMGDYLEQRGLTDTTPAGLRYAQSYGRRPQPPAPMSRGGAGGYSIYDR